MNINVRAVSLAHISLGYGSPTANDMALAKKYETLDEVIGCMAAHLMDGENSGTVFNSFEEMTETWMATLRDLSQKQVRASWPDMMELFEEAGV